MSERKEAAPKYASGSCDSCEYYDYDEVTDSYYCTINLDEDEFVDFMNRNTKSCHYYRFYDEYKSVHKQN